MTAKQHEVIQEKVAQEDLQAILHGYSQEQYHFEYQQIGIYDYIVLGQARLTFNGTIGLGLDIALHGLIHPVTVARFTKEYALAYIKMNNELWGLNNVLPTKPTIIIAGVPYWDILLDGECRTRGIRDAWENGCSECRDKENKPKNWLNKCRKEHLAGIKDGFINASIGYNIPPSVAVSIQFRANQHNSVPADEEAIGLDVWFTFLRKMFGKKITLSQYVDIVRRSESKVRDSMHFCSLPLEIRDAVVKNRKEPGSTGITYGFALQVYRICDFWELTSEEEILHQYRKMVLEGFNLNSKKCEDYIKGIIKHTNGDQTCMLDKMMDETQQKEFKKDNHKKVVEERAMRVLDAGLGYFASVLHLFRTGELGIKNSVFSMNSVVRMFLQVAEMLGRCLPYILEHLPKDKRNISERTIAQTIIALKRLDSHQKQLEKKSKPKGS